MNENPTAEPVGLTPSPEPYQDRSSGLMIFGIMTILLGFLSGAMVLLLEVGQAMAARSATAPESTTAIGPVMALYGMMAAGLVWLGIGSILRRRWARALLLIFSWSWLLMGVVMVLSTAYFLPITLAAMPKNTAKGPALPASANGVLIVCILLIMGLVFIVLPLIWVLFYQSRNVKLTCEIRDPVPRWTDACPLPVLALSLWLIISVPMTLALPLNGKGVIPFFGMFLTGAPCALFCMALAALEAYAAWSLYKLKQTGWWLVLIAMGFFVVSSLMTFTRHDMTEMYRLMGYPEAQIEQIKKTGLLIGNRMIWLSCFSTLPFLGYLLYLRKFLRPRA